MVDLHLHLDGAISLKSARMLARLQNIEIPESDDELLRLLRVSPDCRDLNEFLEKFDFTCSLLKTSDGLFYAYLNLCRELKENHVEYAEIRFAPQLSQVDAFTQEDAVKAVLKARSDSPIPTNVILCCMRGENTHEANMETVRLCDRYKDLGVCAVDLAGAEGLFPTEDYEEEFRLARKFGLNITIHAGEAAGFESVDRALDFGAVRIGHGVNAVNSENTMERLCKMGTTLELCPTSNLCTSIYKDISEFPIRRFMDKNIKVTVNTDDPEIEGTDLVREYKILRKAFSLSKEEIQSLICNAIDASFADEDTGIGLKERIRHFTDIVISE
ncbi:MAG: adenosine deaminase [Lachnospiraceae bacterium]|nr:adenosine deaminase [Lachnospiraceae bacterium]